jgi:hypothetical protein
MSTKRNTKNKNAKNKNAKSGKRSSEHAAKSVRQGRTAAYTVEIPVKGGKIINMTVQQIADKIGSSYMTAYMRVRNFDATRILEPVRAYAARQ